MEKPQRLKRTGGGVRGAAYPDTVRLGRLSREACGRAVQEIQRRHDVCFVRRGVYGAAHWRRELFCAFQGRRLWLSGADHCPNHRRGRGRVPDRRQLEGQAIHGSGGERSSPRHCIQGGYRDEPRRCEHDAMDRPGRRCGRGRHHDRQRLGGGRDRLCVSPGQKHRRNVDRQPESRDEPRRRD